MQTLYVCVGKIYIENGLGEEEFQVPLGLFMSAMYVCMYVCMYVFASDMWVSL
jgi:hypothetical protein